MFEYCSLIKAGTAFGSSTPATGGGLFGSSGGTGFGASGFGGNTVSPLIGDVCTCLKTQRDLFFPYFQTSLQTYKQC